MASNRTEKKLIAEYKRLQKAGYSALRVTDERLKEAPEAKIQALIEFRAHSSACRNRSSNCWCR